MGPEEITRRWREAGVQVRSAIAATLVLAFLVLAASGVLLLLLRRSLTNGIDTTGRARAADIAAQVDLDSTGGLPANAGELRAALNAEATRRSWVQVMDDDGAVLASTSDISGRPALVDLRPASGGVSHVDRTFPFDEDAYRVIARGGTSDGTRFTVLVGQSLGPVEESTKTVFLLLAIGAPFLLASLGAATFVFVGRSLRPVEAIRRTVENINHSDLGERVEVPPGSDEVSRLARTMNEMLERLEIAQRAQRQFVSDASHELRSPVATLMATAEITMAHPDRSSAEEFPAVVLEESRRLERLVGGLLMLARADDHGLHPRPEEVDLDDVLDAERARVASMGTGLTVSTDITAARVDGDRHQLEQVVRNLADNAVRHARSRITLSVRPQGDRVVLEVFDDGGGVAEEDRERIFERFVRLEESRDRASGGTGLGLAIVREIVTAHHGVVSVVGDPDGTRFRVVLPAQASSR